MWKRRRRNWRERSWLPRIIVDCHRSYNKRKEEKQEATRRTRQEGRHSRTRANHHGIEGSNRII